MEHVIEKTRFYGKLVKAEMIEDDVWELSCKCDFVLVDVESLSLDDEFLKYEPNGEDFINFVKKRIIEAIESGTKNFYRPKNDPSFAENNEKISFVPGKLPACGKSYDWWEEAARDYAPDHVSRLGTKNEYYAFLGVLIKKLVKKGMSIEDAWIAVCVDSIELVHYMNTSNTCFNHEPTGSKEVCGFCDLVNTQKLLAWDDEDKVFWRAGGDSSCYSTFSPLANIISLGCSYRNFNLQHAVGWVVLEK